ncbi:hypothetical protein Y032_0108g45 [Ancylostoma ceylanicum]|uniref:Uncharacterized protein n=1 Tax=Ancylostoma ceylanicum TaxID=53326 RepID=A0A016TF42_9BILA|nr:hypothetical protein Y032_0108g45 [Ancylostoma ceylanicum]
MLLLLLPCYTLRLSFQKPCKRSKIYYAPAYPSLFVISASFSNKHINLLSICCFLMSSIPGWRTGKRGGARSFPVASSAETRGDY